MTILPDQRVRHATLGLGTVQRVLPELALVEFDSGEILRVRLDTLELVAEAHERIADLHPDPPLPTLLRATALCIRSINDAWGVFTPSKIQLLPHQLWVCRKVLGTWPTRWLIADDVGLGKTVEAGLILYALLGAQKIQRLLILAPASLVEQWQDRMRKMFDIRLTRYNKEEDTEKGDFWGTHRQVVVSMQTLRKDTNNRWHRLLESEPWDLVLVDEAHHLNIEEDNRTLAYRLLLQLEENRCIRSMIFFTGTPHRGKPYAFFGLLHLLRPDLFDPRAPAVDQLPHLREVMIRNNKQQVRDMDGKHILPPLR